MQVEELYDLTSWIQREIVDEQIVHKYQELLNILSQNAQANQTKQPFESQQAALLDALTSAPVSELSLGQIEILSEVAIASNIGNDGADKVTDVLFRNAIDVATAVEKVQVSIQEISKGVKWAKGLHGHLSTIINVDDVRETAGTVLLRVHFQKEANLSNIKEFKDWGKIWFDIGRGIAMAHGKAPEDISVVGASNGSIVITLAAIYGIAKTTASIIMEALKVAEKIQDIRLKIEEIRKLKLSNKKAEKALADDLKTEKESGIDSIIEDTTKVLKLNSETAGDKITALEGAIKKLVDFVDKGGEVDFIIPDDAVSDDNGDGDEGEEDKDIAQREGLRIMFKEIRKLEQKVHQLEHKKLEKD